MSATKHVRRHEARKADPPPVNIGNDGLFEQIQLRAYYRFCERGCTPGGEVEDWLAAEREVLAARRPREASKSL